MIQYVSMFTVQLKKSNNSNNNRFSYRYSKTILYNDNSTFNTSITGLLPNTIYTCCVLAVTSYGESEPVCQNITTANVTSKCTVYNYKGIRTN